MTMTRAAGRCAAAAMTLATLACGGGSPGAAAAPSELTIVQESAVNERWIGVSPDGMVVEQEPADQCPAEFDLDLALTRRGTEVSGTATTLLRRVEAAGPCGDVLGRVSSYALRNGRIEGDRISFELGNGSYSFAGTIAGTRMTGTFAILDFPQTGRFAVTRQ
jgi:hypothetical protein